MRAENASAQKFFRHDLNGLDISRPEPKLSSEVFSEIWFSELDPR
jgi:hypothetical protein